MTYLPKLLKPSEVAELIGYKPSTLAVWRSQGKGPPYTKVGNTVRYRSDVLQDWITAGRTIRRGIEEGANCHEIAKTRTKRPRGRAGATIRAQRLAAEPLCRDCAEAGDKRPSEEIDHIIPLAFGGTDDDDNIRALCRNCHWMRTREQRRRYGAPPRK